jgi:NhaA family Na+:H+ antiporter
LAASAVLLALMSGLNIFGVRRLWPYLLLAAALWVAVFQSGIHATIAGVLAALTIPLGRGEPVSPLKLLEHKLHPVVMFGVVPLFGFASAGVTIEGFDQVTDALPLGIASGLFFGKQVGVLGAIWLAVRLGAARKPQGVSWRQVYGAALLCGIGFTMSLFIGALAFTDQALIDEAKIGTLAGSLLAGLLGYVVLRTAPAMPSPDGDQDEAAEIFGDDADEDPTVCNDPFAAPR